MKVNKKIVNVIGSVQKHKKIPGFIYNLPEDLRKEIVSSQKNAVVIDAFDVNKSSYILQATAKALNVNSSGAISIVKIEQAVGSRIIIIDRAEYLAVNAYSQIAEFAKCKIPVLLLSSYNGFGARFRATKFYRENNFFDFDYEEGQ